MHHLESFVAALEAEQGRLPLLAPRAQLQLHALHVHSRLCQQPPRSFRVPLLALALLGEHRQLRLLNVHLKPGCPCPRGARNK